MKPGQSRRQQQRTKLFVVSAAVLFLLAAAVVCVSTGLSGKSGLFHREQQGSGRNDAEERTGTDAGTGTPSGTGTGSAKNTIVYDGKSYVYNDHLSNYLLLGIDTTGSIQEKRTPGQGGQSDSIFLISYDRKEETTVGLAIPRDSMTQIEIFTPDGDSLGFREDHLTIQYAYGDGKRESCLLTKTAVSRLLNGLPIGGYAAVNLSSLPEIAELLGGVEVTVPDNDLAEKDPSFTKGNKVVLNSSNTETFLRSRDTNVQQTAIGRMNRQKVFLEAFASTLAKKQKKDASTVSTIYEKMKPEMITNMSNDIFADLAVAERKGGVQTIPGESGHEGWYDVYRIDEGALYEMILRLFYKEVS